MERKITKVYTFNNGMVAVRDQFGQPMPEFQGTREVAIPKLKAAGWNGDIANKMHYEASDMDAREAFKAAQTPDPHNKTLSPDDNK